MKRDDIAQFFLDYARIFPQVAVDDIAYIPELAEIASALVSGILAP